MLPWFILGLFTLVGLMFAARWFAEADPKEILKVVRWLFFGIVISFAGFLLFTGRLALAVPVAMTLLPWFLRARGLWRMGQNFRRATGAGPTGQTSDINTRFLHVTLEHDSGVMSGRVTDGPQAGMALDNLGLDALLLLLGHYAREDTDSERVLEAYLDRVYPDWRDETCDAGENGTGPAAAPSGEMTRAEALAVLGLEEGADEASIKAAHHRLIAALHPDRGGSDYLAAKINRAKDLLLGG